MHCARCFFYDGDVGDKVCGRCGRAYMPEANVYLGLLVLMTGGMAWTLRHLLTGSEDPFVRPMIDLKAWVMWPASIVDRPAYGFVIGAYLAVLALAPIMAAVLYGKRGGLLLAVIEAAVGPSFALAAAAAVGVFITGSHTLRLSSKLASILLGLVPSAAYWFFAVAVGRVDALAPALYSMAYVAPVAAVGWAAAASLVLVLIGRSDRWHIRWPGVALAVMVAGPVIALMALVGLDEVRYQQLIRKPDALQSRMIQQYAAFLDRYPMSVRAAAIRARLAQTLEDAGILASPASNGLPHVAPPEKIWMELIDQNPDSPWAAEARLHVGDKVAAGGDFGHAVQYYREALARSVGFPSPTEDPLAVFSVLSDLFTVGADLEARQTAARLATVRQTACDRLVLLHENRPRREATGRALALYFNYLACKTPDAFRRLLDQVRATDPTGPLADNVAYDLALLEPDEHVRLERLESLGETYRDTDGALLAHLAAAEILLSRGTRDAAAPDVSRLRRAQQHLEDVQDELTRRRDRDPGDFCVAAWADRVEKRLLYVRTRIRNLEAGAASPAGT